MQNLITDVPDIYVGQAEIITDAPRQATGVSLISSDRPLMAGYVCRGGAPASREVELLHHDKIVTHIDGICLAGGSAYGLSAADGLMEIFAKNNRGFKTDICPIPILPTACLFDLRLNQEKLPDYKMLAREAYQNLGKSFLLGNYGAGAGAVSGQLKAGIGSSSAIFDKNPDIIIGAYVTLNSFGTTVLPNGKNFYGENFLQAIDDCNKIYRPENLSLPLSYENPHEKSGCKIGFKKENTTLAVIATNLDLSRSELQMIANMATDGLARAIYPCHTPFDGDILFALSTGKVKLPDSSLGAHLLNDVAKIAADCLTRATMRSILSAQTIDNVSAYREP